MRIWLSAVIQLLLYFAITKCEKDVDFVPETLLSSADIEWEKHHLSDYDFPEHFVNKLHPEDLIETNKPILPEFIYHRTPSGDRQKLILRVSWKAGSVYIPMSFTLDTTIPDQFYMSNDAFDMLEKHDLLSRDDETYIYTIAVNFGGCDKKPEMFRVDPTPRQYEPGNFIGLNGLMRLGLKLDGIARSFSLGCNFTYF